jgi:CubicO group peptidase (beta-lactamase class C family)/predicted aspartyl protease
MEVLMICLRTLLALLPVAVWVSPSPVAAPSAPTDPPEYVDVPRGGALAPMHRIHRIPAVDVSIGGSKPYRFVVDWGANLLAISPAVAKELALAPLGRDVMGNQTVRIDALQVGGVRFRGLVAAVVPFFEGKEEQGVLGLNVMRELLVTLDYPGAQIRFERGALPAEDGRGILSYRPSEGGGPIIPITVAGRADSAQLDTGASRWLLLPESAKTTRSWKSGPAPAGIGIGPQAGARRMEEARLDGALSIGQFTVADPIVTFRPADRPQALLGSATLENFAVTLDQSNHRVRFQRAAAGPIAVPEAPWERPATASAGARAPGHGSPEAPATLPETPEGKRLAAFLAASRAGTEAAVRAFIVENFPASALAETPVEPRLRRILGLITRSGPFDLLEALPPRRDRASMRVRSQKTGGIFEVSLELEEGAGRGVLGVDLDEVADSSADDAPKKNDAELAAAIDTAVSALAARDAFSGVVLLARQGEPFFEKAWGAADRSLGVPNRVDTKFNIGSIGKAFTRAAVMDLVRAGRLSLDDTVSKHLPAARIPSSDRITVDQLLEMTSGLGDIFGAKYEAISKDRLRTLSDFLPLFEGEKLKFEPGQGRAYSNAGYVVLGLIVEKISGRSYWDFVAERVLAPAGMADTGPFGPDEVVSKRAIGYTKTPEGAWRSNVYALPARASSAGGVHSTARDLLRFVRAVGDGRVLQRPAPPASGAAQLGIAGGTVGANAVVEARPDGLVVIVLANLDPPAAEQLARRIRKWAPPGPGV